MPEPSAKPPGPDAEGHRLAALASYAVLDTPPEEGFDDIALIASRTCATPVALVSLVETHRQWFKARVGFELCETPIAQSVCRHALSQTDLLVIPDLTLDPRTRENTLVTGEPGIRFYAGAPLVTPGGVIGTLCVIDTVPRPAGLSHDQAATLQALARQVVSQLDLRRALAERDRAAEGERRGQAQAVADATRLEAMIATQQVVASAVADLDTIFRAIVEGALSVIDAATGAVVEIREGDELVYRTASGSAADHLGTRVPLDGTLSGLALRSERPVIAADTWDDPRVAPEMARAFGTRSMVAVPVSRHGVAVGVLKLQSGVPDAFAPRDILMTQMLAGLVASAFGDVAETETRTALHDAEGRYKAIFDSAVDFAIVTADPDSRITDWNAGAERIMGWSADEARGRPLHTFFTPEDRHDGVPEREERFALAAGSSSDVRWHQRRDGERFWAVGRMMTLRHQDESVRGFLKILQDRTRERRREQRLDLLSRASAALLSASDPTGELLPVLAQGAEMLGFDQSFAWDLASGGSQLLLTHTVGVDAASRAALACVPLDVPLCGIVAETGRPLILSGLQANAEPRYRIARDAGIDAYAGFPVRRRGMLGGVISFASRRDAQFDEEALAFFATLAHFLSITRERQDGENALRASEGRYRAIFESAIDYAIIVMNLDGHVTNWSAGATRILGWSPEEILGRPADGFFTPEDRAAGVPEAEMQRTRTEGRGLDERWHRRRNGERFWASGEMMPLRDEADTVIGFVKILRDRTEERLAATRLAASEATLRTVLDTIPVGVMLAEPQSGRIVGHNARVEAIFGHGVLPAEPGSGPDRWIAFHADGTRVAPSDWPIIKVARDGMSQAELEVEYQRGDGVRAWIALTSVPMHDAEGRLTGGVVVVSDIDARRRAEEKQRLLNHELSHRMKNLLAMVQSIATQTMRNAADVETAKEVLAGRLIALGRAHDLLMGGALVSTQMAPVIRGALLVHEDRQDRFRLAGPDLDIGADQALSLALMLHELATNAAKYGALSNETGHVDLRWEVLADADQPMLRLSWTEVGGPPVAPPARRGFGSRFIERGLVSQVEGELTLAYPSTGVTCTITASLAAYQSGRSPGA